MREAVVISVHDLLEERRAEYEVALAAFELAKLNYDAAEARLKTAVRRVNAVGEDWIWLAAKEQTK